MPLSVAVALGGGYLVQFTSLLGVRSVEVVGTTTIPQEEVRKVAAVEQGTPLAQVDTGLVAARVTTLPSVLSAEVTRSWPSTVRIVVVERTPVAVVPTSQGIHLVDSTGLAYAVTDSPPAGLPELALTTVGPDDPITQAAVTVLAAVPEQLRGQVVRVTADSPGDVELALSDERVVRWGSAADSVRKAAVLVPLLTRPGTVFDVATPDFPTVS